MGEGGEDRLVGIQRPRLASRHGGND
jgi:hypothetical protein